MRDALLHFTIHQPELRPYFLKSGSGWSQAGKLVDSRDDFWPRMKADNALGFEQEGGWAKCEAEGKGSGRLNYLLVEDVAKEAQEEWEKLAKLGAAGSFYMNYALAYYEGHSGEAGSDELLGNAVRVWNNSRRPQKDLPVAARVWRILQLKHPKSPWASRYKYGVRDADYEALDEKSVPVTVRNLFPGVRCRFEPWD